MLFRSRTDGRFNTSSSVSRIDRDEPASIPKAVGCRGQGSGCLWMGWTPRVQLTRSATRASANSTESTTVSLVSLPCAMSRLFERLVLLLHDQVAEQFRQSPNVIRESTTAGSNSVPSCLPVIPIRLWPSALGKFCFCFVKDQVFRNLQGAKHRELASNYH